MSKQQWIAENLQPGEEYAGLILGKNGEPDYHLVVVAITETEADWKAHTAWAKKARGEMPTRRELNLLRANLRDLYDELVVAVQELAATLMWKSFGECRAFPTRGPILTPGEAEKLARTIISKCKGA